jgi:nicotinate-nucleotide adenylyltransferase
MSSTAAMTEPPLGVLGGTFDPIHNAHLRLAETARARFALNQVIFVPAGLPWHRQAPAAAASDRLAMVRIAVADHEGFAVDDSEARSGAPGYTIDTLERLRQRYGTQRPLVLLLGADAFLGLARWHRWRELFTLAHVAVASRPGHDLVGDAMEPQLATEFRHRRMAGETLPAAPAGTIAPFVLSAGTVSATEVRQRLAAGLVVGDLLPAKVVDYIGRRNLYHD